MTIPGYPAERWPTGRWLRGGLLAGRVLVGVAATASPVAAQQPITAFTLGEALARARETAPEGAAARARVDATRTAVTFAGRRPNPLAELRFENWASGAPNGLPWDVFATLTHTVELGGKREARRGLAEAGADNARAAMGVVQHNLALDVSRIYMDALRARERQRLLATRAAELAELVRVIASRVAVGSAPESDLLKMRTEEARAAADVVRARLAASRAMSLLSARLAVDAPLDSLVQPVVPPSAAPDDRAAAARRPEVVAAGQLVESARRLLRLEDSRSMPDVGVNGGLKRTSGFNTGVVAFTFNVPVFEKNRAARIVAQGQILAAEREREAAERRALGEIAATRVAARQLAEEANRVASTLLEPARGALSAARSAFETGAFDILRVLDAERVYNDAALVALDLELDAVVSAIEARLAAGEEPLP